MCSAQADSPEQLNVPGQAVAAAMLRSEEGSRVGISVVCVV